MTYSILVLDADTGLAGVAVASGTIAVGSRVPWARYGAGVVVTQAYTNPALGPLILELLARHGLSARDALEEALKRDSSPSHRQVAVIDYAGEIAVHDGDWVPSWHGYLVDPSIPAVCIANLVVGPEVCENAMRALRTAEGNIIDKLVAALEAAHRAGGDKRGDKSAALLVVGHTNHLPYYDRVVDLRVDFAKDPIRKLRKLYEEWMKP